MRHPTPLHVAYGSASVVFSALLALLLLPTDSVVALTLLALGALALGVAVTLAAAGRQAHPGPRPGEQVTQAAAPGARPRPPARV